MIHFLARAGTLHQLSYTACGCTYNEVRTSGEPREVTCPRCKEIVEAALERAATQMLCGSCRRVFSLVDLWCRGCGELARNAHDTRCTRVPLKEVETRRHRFRCKRCLGDEVDGAG